MSVMSVGKTSRKIKDLEGEKYYYEREKKNEKNWIFIAFRN